MMPISAWRYAALAGPVLFCTLAQPAMAQAVEDDTDVRQMAVRYGDLDLTTAKGRHRLEMRLQRSAAIVCGRGDGDGDWPQPGNTFTRQCYDAALARAHTALAETLDKARMASRQ